ncbi:MAG: DUF2339 domain-containing protein [archaeon]|nr:DUF2339 domain-containing protein [archaeon]
MEKTYFNSAEKLWLILIAFIPLINGLGFVYIGAKKSNKNWIKEGLIYEIPWILLFLSLYHDDIAVNFVFLGFIGILICFIRTLMVFSKLNEPVGADLEHSILGRKTSSSYWVIFSIILFLNGVGLMLVGTKRNVQRWVRAGAAFEILWVLYILLFNAGEGIRNFIISLAFIGWLLSIALTIIVYFEEKRMDNGGTLAFDSPIEESPINAEPEPVKNIIKESPNPEIIPQFRPYNTQINDLKNEFNHKEENITNLINNRFNKEELSYDRFISVIDNCHKIFYHHADSASSIIQLAPEFSERLDESVKGKISIMESINDEMNNLLEELILHDGDEKQSDEDLKELFSNMDNLINSVKDYK